LSGLAPICHPGDPRSGVVRDLLFTGGGEEIPALRFAAAGMTLKLEIEE
jgi:hypothetical protein